VPVENRSNEFAERPMEAPDESLSVTVRRRICVECLRDAGNEIVFITCALYLRYTVKPVLNGNIFGSRGYHSIP
jgi:hypothetical protein